MKAKATGFILITGLLFLCISTAKMSTASSQTSIDQIRPNLIFKSRQFDSSFRMLKGNDTHYTDLLHTTSQFSLVTHRAVGDPTITVDGMDLNYEGQLNVTSTMGYRIAQTFIQRDAYIPDIPVRERFRHASGDRVITSNILNVNDTVTMPQTFAEFQANDTFTQLTRDRFTGFVYKWGVLRSTTLNDTNGDPIATIMGFQVHVGIFLFLTDTQELVAHHDVTESGWGNLLPLELIQYLSDHTINRQVTPNSRGFEQFAKNQTLVNWIDLGYNDTMGLNMYYAGFQYHKSVRSVIIQPTNYGITLNQVPIGLETVLQSLETQYTIPEYNDSSIETLDANIVDQTLTQDNPLATTNDQSGNPTNSQIGNLDINLLFAAQILGLVIISVIAIRRIKFFK